MTGPKVLPDEIQKLVDEAVDTDIDWNDGEEVSRMIDIVLAELEIEDPIVDPPAPQWLIDDAGEDSTPKSPKGHTDS